MQQQPRRMIQALQSNIGKAIVGKEEAIEYALIALLCKGHVLIEDVPGVGKTTLASALAKSLDCSFRRIQFTPDLMPSDVTGYTLINIKTGQMEFKEGAVMSQVVAPEPSRWEMAVSRQVISRTRLTLLPMYFMTLPTMKSNTPASARTLKNTTAKVKSAAVFRTLLKPLPR